MSVCSSQRNPNFWENLNLPKPDYNVTELGKKIGFSARNFNLYLEALGMQKRVRDEKGKPRWELTEAGHEFGHEVEQVAPHGLKMISYIRWYSNVIP
jgi:predicted transcriptional regulator